VDSISFSDGITNYYKVSLLSPTAGSTFTLTRLVSYSRQHLHSHKARACCLAHPDDTYREVLQLGQRTGVPKLLDHRRKQERRTNPH